MRKILFTLLVLLSFSLGISVSVYLKQKSNTPNESTLILDPAQSLAEFSLLDQSGNEVSNTILKDRWSLLFFGFTNCPDVCPNTLSVLSEFQNRIENKAIKPQIIFVTVDPMRDTPERMNSYVQSFSADIIGLTGELHKIQILTDRLGVSYAYNATPDGSYTVDHFTGVFAIDPNGKYAALFSGNHAAQDTLKSMQHDYRILTDNYNQK